MYRNTCYKVNKIIINAHFNLRVTHKQVKIIQIKNHLFKQTIFIIKTQMNQHYSQIEIKNKIKKINLE
jgi:hypothetical protein